MEKHTEGALDAAKEIIDKGEHRIDEMAAIIESHMTVGDVLEVRDRDPIPRHRYGIHVKDNQK